MIVNFHISGDACPSEEFCSPYIKYRIAGEWIYERAISVPYSPPEYHAQRTVYSTLISNLTSNSLYEFRVLYYHETLQQYVQSDSHHLRTFPSEESSTPVNVVFGGDIANNDIYPKMNAVAASHSPYAAFIGGDISYDNGFVECYCMYDKFLKTWEETMVRPDGAMIPIAPAIGNHDVGMDSFASVKYASLDNNYFIFLKGYEYAT
jgi:hypothetical protein